MSIYKKQAVVQFFPAYDIVVREADSMGFVQISAWEKLGLDSSKGFFDQYEAGSVVSYALLNNHDPVAAVAHAVQNKHEIHWINRCGTCLSN